MYLIINKCSRR